MDEPTSVNPTLEYQSPLPPIACRVPAPLTGRVLLIRLLPLAVYGATTATGIGSDFIQVSAPKKLALTVATFAVLFALHSTARYAGGAARAYTALCWLILLLQVFVMWFWN